MAQETGGPAAERARLRVGDTDRQAVADRLREALNEGRLTLVEYDERVRQAYGALTYADLDGLLGDLPARSTEASAVVPAPAAAQPAVPGAEPVPAGGARYRLPAAWTAWGTAVSITGLIWLLTSLSSGHAHYFWPVWVAGPWGAVLLVRTIARPRDRARQRPDGGWADRPRDGRAGRDLTWHAGDRARDARERAWARRERRAAYRAERRRRRGRW